MGKFANITTLVNVIFGVIAIRFVLLGDPKAASAFLVLAVIADFFDGKIAAREKKTDFGKELDSLSDVVSFGAAPAILLMSFLPAELFFLPLLILVAGEWRLARYNITDQKKAFIGIPITFNGVFVPALVFLELTTIPITGAYCVIMSWLMVSKIKVGRIV